MSRLDEILEQVGARHGISPNVICRVYSKNPDVIHARLEVIMLAQTELGMSRVEISRELRISRCTMTRAERWDEAELGTAPDEIGYDGQGRPVI